MADHVRWGVLGASNFARKLLVPALQQSAGGSLTALATRSPEKAAPFAAMAPGVTVHADYEVLLDDPDVDAVYIPLPNHLHVEWTIRALKAGKHVLCEKPMASRAEEIDEIIAARNESGKFCAEAFMVVHHPQFGVVKDAIASGKIGRVRHIHAGFSFYNDDQGNIRNQASAGGGASPDIGVYPTVVSRQIMGQEPQVVSARMEMEDGIDANVHADLLYPDDVTMSFYCSMRMAPWQEFIVHGEKGWIRLEAPFNAGVYSEARVHISTTDGEEVHRFPGVDQYVLQMEAVHRSILEGADYPCSLDFSRGNQVVIDALYEAAGQ